MANKWGVGDSKGGEGHEKKKGKEGHPGWDRVRTDVGEETAFPKTSSTEPTPHHGHSRAPACGPQGCPEGIWSESWP